jgi:hypothetical protein
LGEAVEVCSPAVSHGARPLFSCSRCFGRKFSASDVSFAAKILDRRRFGHPNNSKTLAVSPLMLVNEYHGLQRWHDS